MNRFDIPDTTLLGAGSESSVYEMDATHVLRIYRDNVGWDYAETRRTFFESIDRNVLPFAVPHIYTVGAWVGHVYTVEERMPGRDFGGVLPSLTGEDRTRALSSFVDGAAALGKIRYPDKPYGELIIADAPRQESWQGYLRARIDQAIASSRSDLLEDVPGFEAILASILEKLPIVGDTPEKGLVHGDYFPANVFIGDDLTICGVGDFSYATCVGDARMDLAGAVWLLGATSTYCPDDSTFMRGRVAERWGTEILEVIDFYKLYYSLYFSGCKVDDPTTYWWCVHNLRAEGQ